jgi:hypothetical protein
MKRLAAALIAMSALLSGCIVHDHRHRAGADYRVDRDRDGVHNRVDRDRDGDGVPNRADRRPDNPRRY